MRFASSTRSLRALVLLTAGVIAAAPALVAAADLPYGLKPGKPYAAPS